MFLEYLNQFSNNLSHIAPFAASNVIAVAVSGGADSLALLLLANKWAQNNGSTVIALTIDHSLREESHNEAIYVNEICAKFKIEHHIIKWRHENIKSNVQELARIARYNLLTEFCNEKDILFLLTAHHADDKLENFFIRLSRGSGVIGFTEHNIHYYKNIAILKPIFNFFKKDCYEILKLNKINAIEDPTNSSSKYLRSELRPILHYLFNIKSIDGNLFKQRILSSINNISSTAKIIENNFLKCFTETANIYPEGYGIIDFTKFQEFFEEEQLLTIAHILTLISGNDKIPRSNSVTQLHKALLENENVKYCLHNCIITKTGKDILIIREFGKKKAEKIPLMHNATWDKRFLFELKEELPAELYIDSLLISDFNELKKYHHEVITLPKNIIFTLPAIKSIEKVIAIPHINYYSFEGLKLELNIKLSIKFKPSFVSRLTHYFF